MGPIEVPDAEELPKARFVGGDALRTQLCDEYRVHVGAADRAVDDPEQLSRLLGELDKDASEADTGMAVLRAAESSITTHGHPDAVDACRYYAGLLSGALGGASKQELLSPCYFPGDDYSPWLQNPLEPRIAAIANGSYLELDPPDICGSGHVVRTLEAALWAFHRTDTFRDGALAVVNLGEDADTTGAVYGQLAGAYYGIGAIPEGWRCRIHMADRIVALADSLLECSNRASGMPQCAA